jgi:hypothetical protein
VSLLDGDMNSKNPIRWESARQPSLWSERKDREWAASQVHLDLYLPCIRQHAFKRFLADNLRLRSLHLEFDTDSYIELVEPVTVNALIRYSDAPQDEILRKALTGRPPPVATAAREVELLRDLLEVQGVIDLSLAARYYDDSEAVVTAVLVARDNFRDTLRYLKIDVLVPPDRWYDTNEMVGLCDCPYSASL